MGAMPRNSFPIKVLATLDHDGLRYELTGNDRDEAVWVSCTDATGTQRWRSELRAPDLVVMVGSLGMAGRNLTVVACGDHCKGGEYRYTFTVTPAGQLLTTTAKLG
jgi:hypothetical protein